MVRGFGFRGRNGKLMDIRGLITKTSWVLFKLPSNFLMRTYQFKKCENTNKIRMDDIVNLSCAARSDKELK